MSPQSPQPTAVIQIEDEPFVREAADRIRSRMMQTVQGVMEIGRDLIAVKERLGHGNFLSWIHREFKMADKSAQRFMSVAERFGDKFDSVSNLTLTALYELAAPSTPEEVRAEVAERAAAGESVTSAEVKELKNKIKERDERLNKLRTQKTAADTENRILTRSLKVGDAKLNDLTHQLDSLREELRQAQQGAKINYEPMKAALLSLWNVAPEEIRAWFLEFVMKGSENAGSGGSSPATVN
jgi:Protein of unknown function (DUF3102)